MDERGEILAGVLLDGTGAPARGPVRVTFDEAGIVAVEAVSPEALSPAQARRSVVPGLVDLHGHLGRMVPSGAVDGHLNRVQALVKARRVAREWLASGVTTVRSLGVEDDLDIGLADVFEDDPGAGPRLVPAGRKITLTGGMRAGQTDKIEVSGPDMARHAARQQLRLGSRVLKLYATTLLEDDIAPYVHAAAQAADPVSVGRWGSLTVEEMAAVVDEAHKVGRTVAAHAAPAFGVKHALAAGVDTVEHATWMDEDALELFAATGATMVPTLAVTARRRDHAASPASRELGVRGVERGLETTRRARDLGIPIGAGTDAHGDGPDLVEEIEMLALAGLTNAEAVASATGTAARALGRDGEGIGRIEPGRRADIVVLEGDVAGDLAALRRVRAVYRAGRRVLGKEGSVAERATDHRIGTDTGGAW